MKNTGLKRKIASVVMTAAMLIAPATALAGFGPSGRPTLTYGPSFTGTNHPQFNSIVNNPDYGDERAFFTGRDALVPDGGGQWADPVNVQAGHDYLLRIFIHNNANQDLAEKDGMATGTTVKVALPTQTGKSLDATATIHADNSTPKDIFDTVTFKSPSDMSVSYVKNSASIVYNNQKEVALSDDIVGGGVKVGSEANDGNWRGCFGHIGYVYLKVHINAPAAPKPAISIAKTVAKGDVTGSATNAAVVPGDKVSYGITVTNNSQADATNVVVRDAMPAGVTVNSATLALNGNAATAITNYQQLFTKDGINIGTVKAGKTAVIVVHATVNADATGKECSINLLNTAYTSATGIPESSSSATVSVSKTCETPSTPSLPDTGAEGAAAAALGLTAVGTSVQAYIRSKRGLVKAQRSNR